jgi:hypothetical protein
MGSNRSRMATAPPPAAAAPGGAAPKKVPIAPRAAPVPPPKPAPKHPAEVVGALPDSDDEPDESVEWTPLTRALFTKRCDLASTQEILDNYDFDINATVTHQKTALHLAVQLAIAGLLPLPTVELLIRRGANTEAKDDRGFTVLRYAVEAEEEPNIAALLLDHGASINQVADSDGVSIFHAALKNRGSTTRRTILRLLLAARSDFPKFSVANDGSSTLHVVLERPDPGIWLDAMVKDLFFTLQFNRAQDKAIAWTALATKPAAMCEGELHLRYCTGLDRHRMLQVDAKSLYDRQQRRENRRKERNAGGEPNQQSTPPKKTTTAPTMFSPPGRRKAEECLLDEEEAEEGDAQEKSKRLLIKEAKRQKYQTASFKAQFTHFGLAASVRHPQPSLPLSFRDRQTHRESGGDFGVVNDCTKCCGQNDSSIFDVEDCNAETPLSVAGRLGLGEEAALILNHQAYLMLENYMLL